MATDYPLVGPPTVSLAQFTQVLSNAHSPAAGQAASIYAAIRRYNVDPGVVLAIAQHESNFGKAGIAVGRNNLFGSRYYASSSKFGASNRGGWAAFPNYAASAAYTASLLAGGLYAGSKSYNTAATFPFRYAPSSDGNNPRNYGTSIVNAVNRWSGQPVVKSAGGTTKPKAKAKATTKAKTKAKADTTTPAPAAPASSGMSTITAVGIVGLAAILVVLLVRR